MYDFQSIFHEFFVSLCCSTHSFTVLIQQLNEFFFLSSWQRDTRKRAHWLIYTNYTRSIEFYSITELELDFQVKWYFPFTILKHLLVQLFSVSKSFLTRMNLILIIIYNNIDGKIKMCVNFVWFIMIKIPFFSLNNLFS